MAKWCVRIMDELPGEECVVEAKDADEAIATRARELVEWADLAMLSADPVGEAECGEKKP